eukprot:evm.model.scf_1845.1 EVM.evm.TU.scf_1845.1   scf_1845:3415-4643(-)
MQAAEGAASCAERSPLLWREDGNDSGTTVSPHRHPGLKTAANLPPKPRRSPDALTRLSVCTAQALAPEEAAALGRVLLGPQDADLPIPTANWPRQAPAHGSLFHSQPSSRTPILHAPSNHAVLPKPALSAAHSGGIQAFLEAPRYGTAHYGCAASPAVPSSLAGGRVGGRLLGPDGSPVRSLGSPARQCLSRLSAYTEEDSLRAGLEAPGLIRPQVVNPVAGMGSPLGSPATSLGLNPGQSFWSPPSAKRISSVGSPAAAPAAGKAPGSNEAVLRGPARAPGTNEAVPWGPARAPIGMLGSESVPGGGTDGRGERARGSVEAMRRCRPQGGRERAEHGAGAGAGGGARGVMTVDGVAGQAGRGGRARHRPIWKPVRRKVGGEGTLKWMMPS